MAAGHVQSDVSAKEALFKALYPLAEVFFGFKEAELVAQQGGGFMARLLCDVAPAWPSGSELPVGCPSCRRGWRSPWRIASSFWT